MAETKGTAREAMAEEAVLRMTEIAAFQPSVIEGYTPDPELAEVVKKLLEYLQPVVTQGTSMVLLVSVLFLPYFTKWL